MIIVDISLQQCRGEFHRGWEALKVQQVELMLEGVDLLIRRIFGHLRLDGPEDPTQVKREGETGIERLLCEPI